MPPSHGQPWAPVPPEAAKIRENCLCLTILETQTTGTAPHITHSFHKHPNTQSQGILCPLQQGLLMWGTLNTALSPRGSWSPLSTWTSPNPITTTSPQELHIPVGSLSHRSAPHPNCTNNTTKKCKNQQEPPEGESGTISRQPLAEELFRKWSPPCQLSLEVLPKGASLCPGRQSLCLQLCANSTWQPRLAAKAGLGRQESEQTPACLWLRDPKGD